MPILTLYKFIGSFCFTRTPRSRNRFSHRIFYISPLAFQREPRMRLYIYSRRSLLPSPEYLDQIYYCGLTIVSSIAGIFSNVSTVYAHSWRISGITIENCTQINASYSHRPINSEVGSSLLKVNGMTPLRLTLC